VVRILVHTSESLRVDHYDVHILIGRARDGFLPQPQALCAGVDGRTHLKPAFLLLQQHAIHEETFACTVLPHDGDDSEFTLFGEGQEELLCFFGEGEAHSLLVGYEGDGEGLSYF
jgi:hypothetical protein